MGSPGVERTHLRLPAGAIHHTGTSAEGEDLKYAVLIEKGASSYGAQVPDLPGCVAVAETREEVCRLVQEAIKLYVGELKEGGLPVPQPQSYELVELTV